VSAQKGARSRSQEQNAVTLILTGATNFKTTMMSPPIPAKRDTLACCNMSYDKPARRTLLIIRSCTQRVSLDPRRNRRRRNAD